MTLTIRDVAREAGVSTATVSRALRGQPNVDPSTRRRVLEVARRLDYVISPAASQLASGRARSVAVLTPYVSRWYFASVLAGIEEAMQEMDFDCLLHAVPDPTVASLDNAGRRLRHRVDGVLVIGIQASSPDVANLLGQGFQMTLIGNTAEGASSVLIDDYEGALRATRHLVDLGHRSIGLIGGRSGPFLVERNRLAAYRMALSEAGIERCEALEVAGQFTVAGGERAMNGLLSGPRRPSAVFCMSDEMAFGAMRAVRRHGLAVGADVSIVGFDGHEMAELLELTTVTQPVKELGLQGARALLRQIEDPAQVSTELLPTSLAVRQSSGVARPLT